MIASAPAARAAMTLARPRWPGPRISTRVAGTGVAESRPPTGSPAPSGLNSTAIEAGMSLRIAVQDGARVEVHVVGVRAPQAGRMRQRNVRVAEHAAAAAADLVAAIEAGAAVAAGDQHLDRDAVADVDAPALRRPVADLLDDAERLVSGNHRIRDRQHAGVLLGVAAADAARLDAQQSRCRRRSRAPAARAARAAAGRGLNDGARGVGASLGIRTSARA